MGALVIRLPDTLLRQSLVQWLDYTTSRSINVIVLEHKLAKFLVSAS